MHYKVPTKEDIFSGQALANTSDPYLALCLLQPNPAWVKRHPIIKVKNEMGQKEPLEYIPDDKIQYLLTAVWGIWRREILTTMQIFNAVVVTVRLHYYHPGHEVWYWTDGIGAVGVQTDKDATAANLDAIKSDAVMKAAPSAAKYALKNAAKELGPLFGRDLNKGGTYEIEDFNPAVLTNPGMITAPGYTMGEVPHTIPAAIPAQPIKTIPITQPAVSNPGVINW